MKFTSIGYKAKYSCSERPAGSLPTNYNLSWYNSIHETERSSRLSNVAFKCNSISFYPANTMRASIYPDASICICPNSFFSEIGLQCSELSSGINNERIVTSCFR